MKFIRLPAMARANFMGSPDGRTSARATTSSVRRNWRELRSDRLEHACAAVCTGWFGDTSELAALFNSLEMTTALREDER